MISLMQNKYKQNSRYHKLDNYIYLTKGLQLNKLVTQVSGVCFFSIGNCVTIYAIS